MLPRRSFLDDGISNSTYAMNDEFDPILINSILRDLPEARVFEVLPDRVILIWNSESYVINMEDPRAGVNDIVRLFIDVGLEIFREYLGQRLPLGFKIPAYSSLFMVTKKERNLLFRRIKAITYEGTRKKLLAEFRRVYQEQAWPFPSEYRAKIRAMGYEMMLIDKEIADLYARNDPWATIRESIDINIEAYRTTLNSLILEYESGDQGNTPSSKEQLRRDIASLRRDIWAEEIRLEEHNNDPRARDFDRQLKALRDIKRDIQLRMNYMSDMRQAMKPQLPEIPLRNLQSDPWA